MGYDDDDDAPDTFVRVDIIAELAAKLRASGVDRNVLERIAHAHRLRPGEVPARLVDEYWRRRATNVAGSWLDQLTDDELDLRLWLEQRALEVCKPGEVGDCQDRLDSTLKVLARRGGITAREPEGRRRGPEVVATQRDDSDSKSRTYR